MKRPAILLFCSLLACGTLPSWGVPETPVHLATTKNKTLMTDVLATLSKQADTPILTDDTVTGTLGATTLDEPTLDAMLTTLAAMTPGLTRQKVYLPKDAPLPTGTALFQQITALQAIKATHLVVIDPETRGTVTFQQTIPDKTPPAAAAPAPMEAPIPEGMQVVYLITNETVRAQRLQEAKNQQEQQAQATQGQANPNADPLQAGNPQTAPQTAMDPQAAAAAALPVPRAVNGLKSTFDVFSQMTPDQQRQALPLMFQQFQKIMQSVDPSVMSGLRQQMMQQWQQGRPGANP